MPGNNNRERRGYSRSYALWEETRTTNDKSKLQLLRAYTNAILYEIQPIRFKSIDTGKWNITLHRWKKRCMKFASETLPSVSRKLVQLVCNLSFRNWLWIGGILLYYIAVRIIHALLDAGPIVMILTALITIFTIGLGDNNKNDGISAYSVFNRGFQQLMGSVDAENLLQQHVGGAAAAFNMGDNNQNQNNNNEGNRFLGYQQPEEEEEENNNNEDNNNILPNNNRARKSGKKTRRRNRDVEQRREIQRQRQLAQDYVEGNDNDDIALQQVLLQEQNRMG